MTRPPTRPLPPLRGLVVTGTDTGVGKTVLSCGLLRLAAQQGLALVPFKPAETGCTDLDHPADATALRAAARRPDLPVAAICPHRFRPPVAPAAATTRSAPLRLSDLARAARQLAAAGDAILIEGAGGVLSPYAGTLTILDLAARLGLPLLLVARNALGTVNHTALAISEIRRRALPLLGYVLVDTTDTTSAHQKNAQLIQKLTGLRPYASLHYIAGDKPHADAAARTLGQQPAVARTLRALARPLTGRPGRRASSGR